MNSLSAEIEYNHTFKVVDGDLPESAMKQHHIREIKKWNDECRTGVDEVYFSGEYPSVYYKKVTSFLDENVEPILATHKKIWNQGKVTFLVVESNTEFRVINCSEKPLYKAQTDNNLGDLVLLGGQRDDLEAMKLLKDVFGKISVESGSFWRKIEFAGKIKSKRRVEQVLVENLKTTRLELKAAGLNTIFIHNLLLRSLFVLYLEDRKANPREFYAEYKEGAETYFDILESQEATYRLFGKLETSFNGNLCTVTEAERIAVTVEHLRKIKECFWSKIQRNGQLELFDWRIFDFSVIPIQLISEIYEDFLRVEKGDGVQSATGAFYTPHPLAEFVLNELLPYPTKEDTRYDFKILDPTCGSGIFLVESLNRLLDRWELAHEGTGKRLTFEEIVKIVQNSIFGIEIQTEAIKVAAFSLYLTMLDRLDPKSLWADKQFPYLIFDPKEKNKDKIGNNLFLMDSIEGGPFKKIKFDFVVGNPPFGTKDLKPNVKRYLQDRGYATESVLAFMDRATVLSPEGKIGLIATSKILFNNKSTYQKFREDFFNKFEVEKVYNFSILRKVSFEEGKKYIPNAAVPISIFFYSAKRSEKPGKKLLYCAPKTAIKNQLIDGIAIDPTDIKYLPMEECQKKDSKIWKVAMYGTERDMQLLKTLQEVRSIELFGSDFNWKKGTGFRPYSHKYKPVLDEEIKKYPFLETKYIERYYTSTSRTRPLEHKVFKRKGAKPAYNAPHLLIKEGMDDGKFCASYLDFDCTFSGGAYGIYSSKSDDIKLLSAFLNSRIALYLMFISAVDWGIERNRLEPNEFLQLPGLCFVMPADSKKAVIGYMEEIILAKKTEPFLGGDEQLAKLENEIEISFLDAFKLTNIEKILVEDLLRFSLGAFQDRENSDAYHPCVSDDSKQYAKYLCQTINEFLENIPQLSAWASIFELTPSSPLSVIALRLNTKKPSGHIESLPGKAIQDILREVEVYTYSVHHESIYYRKFIRYYSGETLYIVKPNEKRCWSRSMALNDADEIITEILLSK